MRIGIVGGTGREGRGLALRWAAKGHAIVVGSRDAARAQEKARELSAELTGGVGPISGGSNEEAAGAEVVLLTVPYAAHADTLKGLRGALAGRIVIDITVPLVPPKVTQVNLPAGTSAALEAQVLLDPTTRVVATLHHVSSAHLGEPGHAIIPELVPIDGELVLDKPGKGAFCGTDLQALLRARSITHLVFTGVTTEVCVQTTMREANDRGYECLLLEDGTESYFPEFKAATLAMLRAQGAIVGWTGRCDDLIAALRGAPVRQP